MNFIKFIRRIFKLKNSNLNNLIRISDSFVIPTREVFKENKEMLTLIDSYKEEYKKILSEKKLLFSMDLTNSINENIRMYSELITNIFTNKEHIEGTIETKIKMFYKINKSNLYKQEINTLYLECSAKLISLLEIFNERKLFMPKYKKEAILFAINNLTNAIVVFEAQKSAIEVEKENYLKNYELITCDNIEYENKRKIFIEEKIKLLNRVLPIINEELKADDLSDILLLERKLEIYVYHNKNDVHALKEELNSYYKLILEEIALNEFYSSQKIYNLEAKILLYFYYGKNLINKEDIDKLYELKIKALCYQDDNLKIPFDSYLDIEKEVYKNVIFNKIEKISSGNNEKISKMFGSDSKNAIQYIIEQLKSDGIFDVKTILTSDNLKFLFSFDYDNGYIKYLNNIIVDRQDYSYLVHFHLGIFNWEQYIPITSIYEMLRLNDHQTDLLPKLNNTRFYLYKLWQKHLDYYKLPEGIKNIYISTFEDPDVCKLMIRESFVTTLRKKKLVLPSTLNSFQGRLFPENIVKEFVLNDGIKIIGKNTLSCAPLKELTIPSSLEKIVNDGIYNLDLDKKYYDLQDSTLCSLETITFKDYKNSKLLKNKEALNEFFVYTLHFEYGNLTPKLKTSIRKIVFIDEFNQSFEVNIDGISFDIPYPNIFNDIHFDISYPTIFNNMISNHELESFIEKIKECVQKEFKNFESNKKLSLSKSLS